MQKLLLESVISVTVETSRIKERINKQNTECVVTLLFQPAYAGCDANFWVKRYAFSIRRCGYFSELLD